MGESFIELSNPNNKSKFPLRYTYGSSDVLSNQNVKEAFGDGQYVYSETYGGLADLANLTYIYNNV